jgi:hypothetical protein
MCKGLEEVFSDPGGVVLGCLNEKLRIVDGRDQEVLSLSAPNHDHGIESLEEVAERLLRIFGRRIFEAVFLRRFSD